MEDDGSEPLLMKGSMESPDSMPLKAYRQVLTSPAANSALIVIALATFELIRACQSGSHKASDLACVL